MLLLILLFAFTVFSPIFDFEFLLSSSLLSLLLDSLKSKSRRMLSNCSRSLDLAAASVANSLTVVDDAETVESWTAGTPRPGHKTNLSKNVPDKTKIMVPAQFAIRYLLTRRIKFLNSTITGPNSNIFSVSMS